MQGNDSRGWTAMATKPKLVIEIEIDDACFAAWLMEIAHAYEIPIGKAAAQMLRMIFEDDMAMHDAPEPITLQ
jgi:hypothetical protein